MLIKQFSPPFSCKILNIPLVCFLTIESRVNFGFFKDVCCSLNFLDGFVEIAFAEAASLVCELGLH
jgi:hypothetical protein